MNKSDRRNTKTHICKRAPTSAPLCAARRGSPRPRPPGRRRGDGGVGGMVVKVEESKVIIGIDVERFNRRRSECKD